MTRNGPPPIQALGEDPPPLEPRPANQAPTSKADRESKPKGKPVGERFKTINVFADFSLAQLTRAEIAVWLLLWRDTRDGIARTGTSDLARRAGCNRCTVFRALRRLEQMGLVQAAHRGGLGKGLSRYRVRSLTKED
jgi:hypothetical protein